LTTTAATTTTTTTTITTTTTGLSVPTDTIDSESTTSVSTVDEQSTTASGDGGDSSTTTLPDSNALVGVSPVVVDEFSLTPTFIGIIAGSIGGGLLLIFAIVCLVMRVRRRSSPNDASASASDTQTQPAQYNSVDSFGTMSTRSTEFQSARCDNDYMQVNVLPPPLVGDYDTGDFGRQSNGYVQVQPTSPNGYANILPPAPYDVAPVNHQPAPYSNIPATQSSGSVRGFANAPPPPPPLAGPPAPGSYADLSALMRAGGAPSASTIRTN
jgi:hypothetical protein